MARVVFAFLCLVKLAHGASTDSASSERSPPPDGTTRSLGSILGSCALTLLICVWHTVHFNVPRNEREASPWFKILCSLAAFLLPEVMVAYAAREWHTARRKVKAFRAKGYEWSMTHSFFADMGGFVYSDAHGVLVPIDCDRFLELCERNEISNPIVTVRDIRDKSKSDGIGKVILAIQLTWFLVQVVARGSAGLAVTLVELDTVSMAVLSLIVIGFWWYKPLRPECPHVFYSRLEVKQNESGMGMNVSLSASDKQREVWSDAWKPEPILPLWLIACWRQIRGWKEINTKSLDDDSQVTPTTVEGLRSMIIGLAEGDAATISVTYISLGVTWLVLGILHAIAWDFEFPTRAEKLTWYIASCFLSTGSTYALLCGLRPRNLALYGRLVLFMGALGIVSRVMLAGLMLASLRALPSSAHQTVPWTSYIPHL